jgi:GxxExxY protein
VVFFSCRPSQRREKRQNPLSDLGASSEAGGETRISSMVMSDVNALTSQIIGSAIEVHKSLGPGLLESAYEECLCHELRVRGVEFKRQKALPLEYKGVMLDCGYRLDVLVEDAVIVEVKACDRLEPIHKAQLLTYLKLTNLSVGLLLNFNVAVMRDGIVRVVNGFRENEGQ